MFATNRANTHTHCQFVREGRVQTGLLLPQTLFSPVRGGPILIIKTSGGLCGLRTVTKHGATRAEVLTGRAAIHGRPGRRAKRLYRPLLRGGSGRGSMAVSPRGSRGRVPIHVITCRTATGLFAPSTAITVIMYGSASRRIVTDSFGDNATMASQAALGGTNATTGDGGLNGSVALLRLQQVDERTLGGRRNKVVE